MQLDLQEIAFLVITILFGVLFTLFVIQTVKRHRSAQALTLSLLFGVLACIFAIFSSGLVIPLTGLEKDIFQALQLNLFGIQFFFFYIFFERLRSKDINTGLFAIMISLLLLQTVGLWLRIYLHIGGNVDHTLWFLSDMGYTISGLIVFLGLSSLIYIKTYRYTRELKPIFIALALALVGIGFSFSFLYDLLDFFHISIAWLESIATYTMPLQAIGLFVFTSIYLSDIDYLYRLPNDVFMLMVVTRTGIPLHTVKLKTRKQVYVEANLLSGLLSAINNVFEEILQTSAAIHNISSKNIHLLMEPGKKIISIVITDKISYFLERALKRYAIEFEKQFAEELEVKAQDIATYDSAIDLIKPIFPFFIIDKVITN